MHDQERRASPELAFVDHLNAKLATFVGSDGPPFAIEPFSVKLGRKTLALLSDIMENVIGAPLLVKVHGDEFDHIDPRLKRFMKRMLAEGIIESFRFQKPTEHWPALPLASYILAPILPPSGQRRRMSGTDGSSCAFDYNTAATKATAEVLERYSLFAPDLENFVTGSFIELRHGNAIDPRVFSVFSEAQLADPGHAAKHAFDAGTKFRWVSAKSLLDKRNVLVPAQLVYLGYELLVDEPIIRQTTTSGAAAGSSRDMAAYRAICEAVERDALMIFWLNKLAPPRIDVFSMSHPVIQRLLGIYHKYHIQSNVFDITTDIGIPTVLTITYAGTIDGYAPQVGVSTDLDVEQAVIHALFDGLKAGFWKKVSQEEIKGMRSGLPRTIPERRIFWSDSARFKHIQFLLSGQKTAKISNNFLGASDEEKLKALTALLRKVNFDAYLADVTAPLAKDAGLTVLMALIPQLYPLYLNEQYKYLGVKRLYEAPLRMGYLQIPRKEEEMNFVPHPML